MPKKQVVKKNKMVDIDYIKKHLGPVNGTSLKGYLDATEDMIPFLEEMLIKAKSFEELKKELTSFCQDRNSFIDYTNYGLRQLEEFRIK